MKYTVVIHKGHVTEVTCCEKSPRKINKRIFEILTENGIETETAIDCASWCEIADADDSYNAENFVVYVAEK